MSTQSHGLGELPSALPRGGGVAGVAPGSRCAARAGFSGFRDVKAGGGFFTNELTFLQFFLLV